MVKELIREGRLIVSEGVESRLSAADESINYLAEKQAEELLNKQGDVNNIEKKVKSIVEITTKKQYLEKKD